MTESQNHAMTDPRITESIPHRPPMLLVDAIDSIEDDSIVCVKTFQAGEFFFQGHFPDNPIVPGVILCECAAQAGAILLFQRDSGESVKGTPLLTRISDVRLKQMVVPGDTISLNVALEEKISSAYIMSAKIRRDGKLVASVNFTCTIHPGK